MNNSTGGTPSANGFEWLNRNGCVESLAAACLDQGAKYEAVRRGFSLRPYCVNPDRMTKKQSASLKRDVMKRSKDLACERRSAEEGDIVKVPKLVPNPLIGGYRQEGRLPVEAEVLEIRRMSNGIFYKVRRLADGGIQDGNGHMIKGIVRRAAEAPQAAGV